MSAYRGDRAPFATFRRIAAEMNQRMAAMMRLMAAVPTIALDGASGLRLASDGSLPGGSYRFVPRSATQGGCPRTAQLARAAADAQPYVATRTVRAGDGPADAAQAPALSRTRTRPPPSRDRKALGDGNRCAVRLR